MPDLLPPAAVQAALAQLNTTRRRDHAPWQLVDGKLHKTFVFPDFARAFGFMTQTALAAERMNHHPEWRNVYKTVAVDLTTHESGGLTSLDFDLAQRMEDLLQPAA